MSMVSEQLGGFPAKVLESAEGLGMGRSALPNCIYESSGKLCY